MTKKEKIEHFNLFRSHKQFFFFKRKRSLYILIIILLILLSGGLVFLISRSKFAINNSNYSISSLKLPSNIPNKIGGFKKIYS